MLTRRSAGLAVCLLAAGCPKQNLAADNSAAADLIRSAAGGGSSTWDGIVKSVLLERFDKNGSLSLDTSQEVAYLSCDTWWAIETSLLDGGQYEKVRQIYGFTEGYIWVGGELGFDEAMRATADAAMAECSLPAP